MLFIFSVIIILVILYRAEHNGTIKQRIISVRIAFVLLLCFIGLRGHLYSDFVSYYYFFSSLHPLTGLKENFLTSYFEPGFVLYSTIIKTIVPNYHFWVFVNTAIDLLVFFWFFKRYTNSYILPCIFFIAFNGLFWECNLYRNIKGLEFFLLSLPYFERKSKVKFVLLNLIGFSFHSSSIFYLLFWPFYKTKIKSKYFVLFAIFANFVYLLKIPLIGGLFSLAGQNDIFFFVSKYSHFTDASHMTGYGLSFGYFERLFTFILFLSYRSLLTARDERFNLFYNCYFLYYIFYLLFYESFTLVQRGPLMFNFSIWIIYSALFISLISNTEQKDLFLKYKPVFFQNRYNTRLIISILLFLEFFVLSNDFKNYDNLLWGIESFESRSSKVLDVLNERGF